MREERYGRRTDMQPLFDSNDLCAEALRVYQLPDLTRNDFVYGLVEGLLYVILAMGDVDTEASQSSFQAGKRICIPLLLLACPVRTSFCARTLPRTYYL